LRRGEVWWAELGKPQGSSPGYRRPVVILQSDDFNESAIGTVVVVTLTSNQTLAAAPGNILCRPRHTGLPKPSVINVSQIATIDKIRLLEKVGTLPARQLMYVESGVRLVLQL